MTRLYWVLGGLFLLAIIYWKIFGGSERKFHEWLQRRWPRQASKRPRWAKRRAVVFPHGDRSVAVLAKKTGNAWRIEVMLDWIADEVLDLELAIGKPDAIAPMSTIALPGLGLPMCVANDAVLANKLLGGSGKNELVQLLIAFPIRSMSLVVSQRWTLEAEISTSDYEVLANWVSQSLKLHDQMRVQSQTEVTFERDSADGQTTGELICGVCGQSIETDLVRCRKCRSPHHRDCWDYNGRCSTYGCQEVSWIA